MSMRSTPGSSVTACASGRARPRLIYHVCAGNLAVSAWTSLAHGLLLGARNVVKLPGDRDDSTARRDILRFIRGLPAPLRGLIQTDREVDAATLRRADAVIAFGSDAAMESLRAQTRWDQKFIAHGPALSLLWLAEPDLLTPRQARACAIDILAYDQLGCLSPQAIYVPLKTDIARWAGSSPTALESQWRSLPSKPARPLGVAARIAEARDLAPRARPSRLAAHPSVMPAGPWSMIPIRRFSPRLCTVSSTCAGSPSRDWARPSLPSRGASRPWASPDLYPRVWKTPFLALAFPVFAPLAACKPLPSPGITMAVPR
jgi:hypothetical protein